jgi:hypothetical protein
MLKIVRNLSRDRQARDEHRLKAAIVIQGYPSCLNEQASVRVALWVVLERQRRRPYQRTK